ncbi:cadherin-2-like [Petromyzon marinus]|uniref:cadherin-2-like n=1 Tax=Petromyzon marinus TaxID=7757 RepID=UPI003F71492D
MRGLYPRVLLLLPLLLLLGAVRAEEQSRESQGRHGGTPKRETECQEEEEERQEEEAGVGAAGAEEGAAHGGEGGVLAFRRLRSGRRRRQKRGWLIPAINVPENDRGPSPRGWCSLLKAIRGIFAYAYSRDIKSNTRGKIRYSIVGPGADQNPTGVFVVNSVTGRLSVTKTLDRELIAEYLLKGHAVDMKGHPVENPMKLVINVIDMNDNRPEFATPVFQGSVAEGSPRGTAVMRVEASDKDDALSANGMIRYKIMSQAPKVPLERTFTVDNATGVISTIAAGLDRERTPQYVLVVQALDMEGDPDIGLANTATAIVTITDKNDNAPEFTGITFTGTARENAVNVTVTTLTATDVDEPGTPAWRTRYVVRGGDPGKNFAVETDPRTNDGRLYVVKPLDFESSSKYNLVVAVENEASLKSAEFGPASTATVTVTVEDENEGPTFEPPRREVKLPEGLPMGHHVTTVVARDPDTAQGQAVRYKKLWVPGDWLDIDPVSGKVTTAVVLDREAALVQANTYTATFLATDDGDPVASGTGTLALLLSDVNDNAPVARPDEAAACGAPGGAVDVTASWRPGTPPPTTTGPSTGWTATAPKQPNAPVHCRRPAPRDPTDESRENVAAPDPLRIRRRFPNERAARDAAESRVVDSRRRRDSPRGGSQLRMKTALPEGLYLVPLLVTDSGNPVMSAVSELQVKVCACDRRGDCVGRDAADAAGGLDVAAAEAALLCLLLLLLLLVLAPLFVTRKRRRDEKPLCDPEDEEEGGDVFTYDDDEGGGEEDRDYDPALLLLLRLPSELPPPEAPRREGPGVRHLDERPSLAEPRYPHPSDIGYFISEGLRTADDDTTTPPYDSLHVFHHEGDGSLAGSLSSLGSSSTGGGGDDDDHHDHHDYYERLNSWGPRFRKLADMYGGGCDD